MISCSAIPEPADFGAKVRIPGETWLREHPEPGAPKDLWSPFKPQLAAGFRQLCAYSALYEPVGTVDHFVSLSEDRARAYDWSNYRFASAWINSSKKALESRRIVDPFEVREGWFEILLPSLQLVVAEFVPAEYRDRCEFVLQRLHLRDDERILRQRREWYRLYQDGELSLEGLTKKAPLIAAAVRKVLE